MKNLFRVARRQGCENAPIIIVTFEAEDIVEATRMVVEKYGQCYVAKPTKAMITSEEADRVWLQGVINGRAPVS